MDGRIVSNQDTLKLRNAWRSSSSSSSSTLFAKYKQITDTCKTKWY